MTYDRPIRAVRQRVLQQVLPVPVWKISQHRIQHVTYEREIKAASVEDAMRAFEEGTAWPSSYDDSYGAIVQEDDPVAVQVPDPYGDDCCYHDLNVDEILRS